MGDMVPTPTRGEYEAMQREYEGAQNRAFFDREKKAMADMKRTIDSAIKARWRT
jgi:hypothetical protein